MPCAGRPPVLTSAAHLVRPCCDGRFGGAVGRRRLVPFCGFLSLPAGVQVSGALFLFALCTMADTGPWFPRRCAAAGVGVGSASCRCKSGLVAWRR
eukprot:7746755-Alexandrium_andersonii.AAC.1